MSQLSTVNHHSKKEDFEKLIAALQNETTLEEYAMTCADVPLAWLPRLLGAFLVAAGNLVYGEKPTYLKFRAVEVIARVPYHSWASAAFTLMTMFYGDAKKALELSNVAHFSELSADNETMHVVVVTELTKKHGMKSGVIRFTLIPMFFAFFYYWMSYMLYLMKPVWSLQLNYLFESHAFEQYSRFVNENEAELRKATIDSEYLRWYGRNPISEYEFFRMVRADEIVHRNASYHEFAKMC